MLFREPVEFAQIMRRPCFFDHGVVRLLLRHFSGNLLVRASALSQKGIAVRTNCNMTCLKDACHLNVVTTTFIQQLYYALVMGGRPARASYKHAILKGVVHGSNTCVCTRYCSNSENLRSCCFVWVLLSCVSVGSLVSKPLETRTGEFALNWH